MTNTELSKNLNDAIYNSSYIAMMKTFTVQGDNIKEVCEEFAKGLADNLAPLIAKYVDGYIKSMSINLSGTALPQVFTVVGTSPTGPVTGTATGSLTGVIKNISPAAPTTINIP